MKALFLILLIPVIEIALFIQAGSLFGTGMTILLTLITAVIGLTLIRQQGVQTLFRAQQKMNTGEVPAFEMLEGMLFAIAGVCLLTPGFFTDTIGFLILIPPLRRTGIIYLTSIRAVTPTYSTHKPGSRTIEGEYHKPDQDS